MSPLNQSPVYNLKAVLNETGLKADVLRAWERRYELPQPRRTPGGHRLYSEYDIATVKWLKSRQSEGFSISRAVELWKEAVETGHDPLLEAAPVSAPAAPGHMPAAMTSLDLLRHNWLEAVLAFDSIQADEALNQAFAIYPLETVCAQILQRGMSGIGNDWHLDKATVQQEHFASAMASRRLEMLIAAAPRPTRQQTILLGCPPGEQHTFPVLLLNLLLCRSGLKVVYLGADVPLEQLEETSRAVQADWIVLAAQQLTTAAALQSTALALQQQGIPLAYGGLIFNRIPLLRERIPAVFLGESLDEGMRRIEQLVVAPAASVPAIHGTVTHQALARLYQEKRLQIEATVFAELQKGGYKTEHMDTANAYFGNGLAAALTLGDPSFLETDLEWVKRLLTGRQIPEKSLIPYLSAYLHSLRRWMGPAAAPLTDWIGPYITREETKWPQKSS